MVRQETGRQQAADIVRDAGGRLVGRTKLQKVAYLLELAGLGAGFQFEYRHYGPYSEDLADAMQMAVAFDLVSEEERMTDWGVHIRYICLWVPQSCSAINAPHSRNWQRKLVRLN